MTIDGSETLDANVDFVLAIKVCFTSSRKGNGSNPVMRFFKPVKKYWAAQVVNHNYNGQVWRCKLYGHNLLYSSPRCLKIPFHTVSIIINIIIIAYIVIKCITRIETIINMIHFLVSTKTAPVLVESLADKKVKIGELVELSVAGSHSSNIWQDHRYHRRQNVVVPFVAKVNDKMIKRESISEMISVLLTIVTWRVIRSRWLDSLPSICLGRTSVIIIKSSSNICHHDCW